MASAALSTISASSFCTFNAQTGLGAKSKPVGLSFNAPNSFGGFSGLKAVSPVQIETETSFLGKESNASLQASFGPKRGVVQRFTNQLQPQASSFKVAVLGAAGGIGQPLALLIKMSPLVSAVHLYDIANVKGVAADLSHCNTPSQVLDFTGPSELANCLKGVDVVVIPAGVPRKPGMTRDDLFNINASIVKTLVEAVADNCPDAFIHIISNPVNSTVPIVAEVLKQKGVYDPKKLFGVTTLDVVRANTFVAQKKNLKLIDVDVPVIGGHAGITILPLLSKTRPSTTFTDEEVEELTVRIQNAGTEVVEAKAGAGSATLSMAYAAARFVESSLRALDGDGDVYECSFIQSELTELPFFASRIKLGKNGVEAVISADLQGLTQYEEKALEALKPELKASIEKGLAFAQKLPAAASA
ncbi:putative malate dehydrogenase [Dioscorea sansibarensis]